MIFKNNDLANDQNYVIFATAVYLVLVVMHFFSYEKKNNKISDPCDITRAWSPKLHLLVQIFWGEKEEFVPVPEFALATVMFDVLRLRVENSPDALTAGHLSSWRNQDNRMAGEDKKPSHVMLHVRCDRTQTGI